MNWKTTAIFAAVSFLIGSIPFSLLLVRAFSKKDISAFGEGNPGPANAFRAGGPLIGIASLLLDGFKAAIPVYFFAYSQEGWARPIIAIAPVLGHAFSPFLRFKGGKAITSSFGSWLGLTLWEGPMVMGAGAAFSALVLRRSTDGLKLVPILSALALYLFLSKADATMWAFYAGNCTVLIVKQSQYSNRRGGGTSW